MQIHIISQLCRFIHLRLLLVKERKGLMVCRCFISLPIVLLELVVEILVHVGGDAVPKFRHLKS